MPNIPYYETGSQFYLYDVVYFTGINSGTYNLDGVVEAIPSGFSFRTGYYYCKSTLNSGSNYFYNRPDGKSGNKFWTQDFFFVPTYGSTVNFKANYYENDFQDYYTIILGKSENIVQVTADLKFNGITDSEAKALNHFYQKLYTENNLESGQGAQPVQMNLFPPHDKVRPYYIRNINNNFETVDFNNVSLSVESPFVSLTDWKGKLIPYDENLNDYRADKEYSQYDYVFISDGGNRNGFYYFSGENKSTGISPLSSGQDVWTQNFFFKPDLVQELSFESKLYKNDLGDFYLYQKEGINPNFFDFSLTFSNRKDKECKALLHFLELKNGIDVFKYDMHTFFTGTRNFYCPEWSHSSNFVDNNTITAKFIESKLTSDKIYSFNSAVLNKPIDFGFVPYGFSSFRAFEILNSGRRYPVTYSYLGESNSNNNFFQYASNQSLSKQVNAGSTGLFDVVFQIPKNASNLETSFSGFYIFSQDSENIGAVGENLQLDYTGRTALISSSAPFNFLSGVENCVAAPSYSSGNIGLEVRWTLPKFGYYFNNFFGEVSTGSGFFPPSSVTGSSIAVNLNDSSYLYEIGVPQKTTYKINFNGPFNFDTDYYIRVSGQNTDYLNHTGVFVFASGVSDVDAWPNPAISYPAVQSGLTAELINKNSLAVPKIRFTRQIESKNIINQQFQYFDVYDYIKNNCSFGDSFNFYSGIVLNFENTSIGPTTFDSNYDIYNTGSLIVTGNYSSMPSGLTLNFYNSSNVYGKGGSSSLLNNDVSKTGKNAIYIKCSGNININLDFSSKIGAGGGAGENIELSDVVSYLDLSDKFDKIKPTSYNYLYAQSGIYDRENNIKYSKQDIDQFLSLFNSSSNIKINSLHASTKGSSILYKYFQTNAPLIKKEIIGGAGAFYGTGKDYSNTTYVSNATDLPSSPYSMYGIISFQKNFNTNN